MAGPMPVPARPDTASAGTHASGADPARYAAAAYLRELLLRPGQMRRRWEQYAERNRRGQINQLAVAEVLARHLWHRPRRAGDADILPRQLKDTAARALSGKLLSKGTLALFMDAFGLPAPERDHLWLLWEGSPRVKMLSGARAVPEDSVATLGPALHRTLALHDHHYLGPDGLPLRHRTIQVIEAFVDGLDHLPYRADTNAVSLEIGQGCRAIGDLFLADPVTGLYAMDIQLAKPLAAGETATLEYTTRFHYPVPPPPEFRRAVLRSVESLDVRVEFHPDRLPRRAAWAVWDGIDGPIILDEEVPLDSQHAVHRYVRLIEKTVAGFHWEW
ncbi:MAG: hypothetical protein JOY82_12530 [Streptosporangiaceae bacterium]|nr:hypothetical protein [Streptosporangiaceae bacterium]